MSRLVGRLGISLLLTALFTTLLTACTAHPSRPDGSGAAAAGTPGAPGPIVVASGEDVSASGIRGRLIKAWNAAHPDTPAKLVELPGDADEQRSQLAAALQSGSASYDVVNLDITWVPEFAEAGLVQPLPASLDDSGIIDRVRATGIWRNTVYAVPWNTDVGLLYYRADYLKALGLPLPDDAWDWTRLTETMDTLAGAHNSGDPRLPSAYRAAWVGQMAPYEGLTVNTLEAFWSANPADADITDASGHYTATADELEAGLSRINSLGRLPYGLRNANSPDTDENGSLNAFAHGETAFLRNWPYAYADLKAAMPRTAQIGVTRLPGAAALGGQDLAVARNSAHAAAAEQFIQWMTGEDSERCLLDGGFAATRTDVYEHISTACGKIPAAEDRDLPSVLPPYASELLKALLSARPRPRTPYYEAVTQAVQGDVHAMLVSSAPNVGATARTLDADLKRALRGK